MVLICLPAAVGAAFAQQTNPVDRQVTNPITDTPNVNPLQQEQPIRPRRQQQQQQAGADGTPETQSSESLTIDANRQTVSGPPAARVVVYEGNVDARIGIFRLQADQVTVYEATNRVVAEGSVVFDQGDFQRITGARAEWNYATKTGFFVDSTGFTSQTQDGTVLYFTAERVEKVAPDTIIILNAEITSCDEDVPKWSFRARRAEVKLNDRVRAKSPTFNVKGRPVFYLPYVSVPIKRRDRASGFLTPTFGASGPKGFRISDAYYLTLGRSADVTFRGDIFTSRGLGFGADLRTRANSRSFMNLGFYAVKDRIFGRSASAETPDQGGSSFYADGVHYFPNGFVAAADINITSNLSFRQIFSDSLQQAISPEERSQLFINKNFSDYSFNVLARTQVTSIPNVRIRTRSLPGITLDKRPTPLNVFARLPVYFSFEGGIEGMSRKETVDDLAVFRAEGFQDPLITPSIVQRFDIHPTFSVPFNVRGWTATAVAGVRATYYSNSLDPLTRLVLGRDVVRGYGEFKLDVRPPALARNFRRGDGSFFFRHTIEPYLIYRKISGISNFERIVRFDYVDAIANTSEIEYGLANRFFTRRSTENVSGRTTANSTNSSSSSGEPPGGGASPAAGAARRSPLASQPYEAFSLTLRQKYFFDPRFGGALDPGRRNQFYPINTFSGFGYGGVARRFSPLYLEARYRPNVDLFADVRMNLDVQTKAGGLRDLAVSFGINRPLVRAFQTFYYTRAITLAPALRRFSDPRGNEPGTLQGSQWSPALFLGNTERGLFGGLSFFFDFQNRPGGRSSALVGSTATLGYSWNCCAVTAQHSTFDIGLRKENRILFSFRLNGIGTFGTEQFGQNLR